jgi:hypothetical protein
LRKWFAVSSAPTTIRQVHRGLREPIHARSPCRHFNDVLCGFCASVSFFLFTNPLAADFLKDQQPVLFL